jgi:solute carrier family 25 protein 39/40
MSTSITTWVDHRRSLYERIVSATAGALLTSLVVTPLEVVKVRLQSQASMISAQTTDLSKARTPFECPHCKDIIFDNGLMEHRFPKGVIDCKSHAHQFSGTFDALRWIIRCEGVGALFNGLSATLWMAIPATVLYFATYEELRDRLNARNPKKTNRNALLAGASARVFAATMVAPLELIRTNAQAESKPPSLLQMTRNIARKQGIPAFWRGLSPTLWRDVPFSAFYWVMVEMMRQSEFLKKQNSTAVTSLVAGSTSGVVAAILTHPFDVIKTRRQVFDLANTNPPTKSTLAMVSKIIQQDGIQGLYVGILPRCAKIAPSAAIMLTSYEVGKRFFHGSY